jgi:hypothetical protein
MRGRWMRGHRLVGVVLGVTLFVLLPMLFIIGAIDCTRADPGPFCSIVRLAFDDGPARSPKR